MANLDEIRNAEIDARHALEKAQNALRVAETAERIERRKHLRDLAEMAHDLLCPYNHTDGCSWGYEQHGAPDEMWENNSPYNAHRRMLDKVEAFFSERGPQMVGEVRDILISLSELKRGHTRLLDIVSRLRP